MCVRMHACVCTVVVQLQSHRVRGRPAKRGIRTHAISLGLPAMTLVSPSSCFSSVDGGVGWGTEGSVACSDKQGELNFDRLD